MCTLTSFFGELDDRVHVSLSSMCNCTDFNSVRNIGLCKSERVLHGSMDDDIVYNHNMLHVHIPWNSMSEFNGHTFITVS